MRHIFSFILIMFFVGSLLGCDERSDYHYYMTHPQLLKRVLSSCQAHVTEANLKQCKTVEKAAHDFNALFNSQQYDPEAFGEKILQAQVELVQAKEAYMQAKAQSVASDETSISKLKIVKAAYLKKRGQVNSLLAVTSISSPE